MLKIASEKDINVQEAGNQFEKMFPNKEFVWENCIKKMIEELARINRGRCEMLGPLGLRNEILVKMRLENSMYYAAFTPVIYEVDTEEGKDLRLIIQYDTGEQNTRYKKDSVGDIHRMNNIVKRVTDELLSTPIAENAMFFLYNQQES